MQIAMSAMYMWPAEHASVMLHLQAFRFCGNRPPVLRQQAIVEPQLDVNLVQAAAQSNSSDCGCHALLNVRYMASVAVRCNEVAWGDLQLPAGCDAGRDREWREQLLDELVLGECELCRLEDASAE